MVPANAIIVDTYGDGYVEEIIPGVSKKVEFIDAPLLEIYSSRIREMVAGGGPYRYYLPGSVYEIITRLRLCRD